MSDTNQNELPASVLEMMKATEKENPKPSPAKKAALNRRLTLAHLPKEARTTIAFLDAEEQMLELRLARRHGGDPRYPIEARKEFRSKYDSIVHMFERVAEVNNPRNRPLRGPGAYHRHSS